MAVPKKPTGKNLSRNLGAEEDYILNEIIEERDEKDAKFISHENIWSKF